MNTVRRFVGGVYRAAQNRYFEERFNRTIRPRFGAAQKPVGLFQSVGDAFWLWVHTDGCRVSPELQAVLPQLPSEELQRNFTGAAGDETLREAHNAFVWFKSIAQNYGKPLDSCERILDFGCGWGRIIRFFLKDCTVGTLWGVDQAADVIEICKQTNPWCNFELIDPYPPTPFSHDAFDLIYCYSVFSHLSEDLQLKLVAEFQRILKPNGLLIATTRDRSFIDFCRILRQTRTPELLPEYLKGPAACFLDTEQSLKDFDSGHYCFSSYNLEGRWSFFGEACIPEAYVRDRWTKHLSFLEFIVDRRRGNQNAIVVRKTC
jgi:SAM-dependent methyltransferase